MPPPNFPGFYFDEDRKKYFPLSSKPKGSAVPAKPKPIQSESGSAHKRRRAESASSYSLLDNVRIEKNLSARVRIMDSIQANQFSLTSLSHTENLSSSSPSCSLTSLAVSSVDSANQVAGGADGFVSVRVSNLDMYGERTENSGGRWDVYVVLSSPITYVGTFMNGFLALSFGPHPTLVLGDFEGSTCLLQPNFLNDVRAASWRGKSLVLGCSSKVFYIPEITQFRETHTKSWKVNSDVLALHQSANENTVVVGTRSGHVRVFDVRRNDKLSDIIRVRSSVTDIVAIRGETEMLVSAMNGDLASYDLRFLRTNPEWTTPVVEFRGHVNSYTPNLGLALDPTHSTLFAASQDCRVRAWSTRSGKIISPPPQNCDANTKQNQGENQSNTLLHRVFEKPVLAMTCMEEGGGLVLRTACGANVDVWDVGKEKDLNLG